MPRSGKGGKETSNYRCSDSTLPSHDPAVVSQPISGALSGPLHWHQPTAQPGLRFSSRVASTREVERRIGSKVPTRDVRSQAHRLTRTMPQCPSFETQRPSLDVTESPVRSAIPLTAGLPSESPPVTKKQGSGAISEIYGASTFGASGTWPALLAVFIKTVTERFMWSVASSPRPKA